MNIPWIRGRTPGQAHVGLPDGTFEEEYARDGFFGAYAHLYRTHPPVGWSRIEGSLRPRAYVTEELLGTELVSPGLFSNADAFIDYGVVDAPMPFLVRNAEADTLLFVHEGAGRCETDFGPLSYEPGDYVAVPRGTSYRLCPTSRTKVLVVGTRGALGVPERGLLGQHALFDPAVLQIPTPEGSSMTPNEKGEYELRIFRRGAWTRVFYPFCPLDVVGYKATLCPMKLNVRDIRPVASDRYHLPPTAHATFVADGVYICTFLPRPLENGDPAAMKVPFYHSNADFDEVLFYHSGDFFSREGIRKGMFTLHPQGIHHGPQPGASERAKAKARTEEVAVMIDTRLPLEVSPVADKVEVKGYWESWKGEHRRA